MAQFLKALGRHHWSRLWRGPGAWAFNICRLVVQYLPDGRSLRHGCCVLLHAGWRADWRTCRCYLDGPQAEQREELIVVHPAIC